MRMTFMCTAARCMHEQTFRICPSCGDTVESSQPPDSVTADSAEETAVQQ